MNAAAIERTDTAALNPAAGIQQAMLPGNRLHLQHGPINLVIEASAVMYMGKVDDITAELVTRFDAAK